MKDTIDEGFFGFFLDLEAKKKRPAGEAIENKLSELFKYFLKKDAISDVSYNIDS